MKRPFALILFCALFIVPLTGCQPKKSLVSNGSPAQNSPVLATYDGRTLTAEEFIKMSEQLSPQMRGSVGAHRREFLDQVIDQYFLEKEARRLGMDRSPEVRETVRKAEGQIIAGKLIEMELEQNSKLAPGEVRKYYDEHKSEFIQPMQYRLSQMTFETAQEAEAAKKELDGGADFAEVAKRSLKDPVVAAKGGDVGFFSKGSLIPELETQALALKVGETSGVFKTEYGHHILKLTDLKESAPKAFDSVSPSLERRLLEEKQKKFYEEYMKKIRGGAKVTVDEKRLADVPFKDDKGGFPMGGGMIRPPARAKNE